MAGNVELSKAFDLIAKLLELTTSSDKDKFRVIAHQRASRLIGDHPEDLVALAGKPDGRAKLLEIEGIGPKIADKIVEFAGTGKIKELDELLKEVPAGLIEVFQVPGLGPKTVRALWKELGIQSIADLKRAIADETILKAPRMGAKTVKNITDAMAFAEKAAERLPLGVALPIGELLVERMRKVKGVKQADFAGSMRRGKDTIGDIDVLVATDQPEAARDAFTSMPEVEKVLAKGESKCSVRLWIKGHHVQSDLRLIPKASYGAAMLYFTGSKEFNVRMRELALKKRQTLNEYGLFPEDEEATP
ncbi:MAG TPA: nucleotidyltransferase domain-containing protein, partial [Phycisphaerales bacterium]|nr:nucleotidyltransferase domain-containing protein [Phycisphaerales bacterium]